MIGQSFGGYTALVSAGAHINIAQLRNDCKPEVDLLDISLLLQCWALALGKDSPDYAQIQQTISNLDLGDRRVKAVLALNPVTSSILGQAGLSRIEIPVAIGAGTADIVTPVFLEQIQAFNWLTTPEKYLGVSDKGTHTDLISGVSKVALPSLNRVSGFSETNAILERSLLQTLSTAFMKVYLAQQTNYRGFLSASYINTLDRDDPSKTYVVRSLPARFAKRDRSSGELRSDHPLGR